MKTLIILTAMLIGSVANAAKSRNNLGSDMDALGGNRELMERASAIDPKNSTKVVQQREVGRDLRFEIGIFDGIVAGGDPYVNTNNFGGELGFHFSPRWSVGARYYQSANRLSSEGSRIIDQAEQIRKTDPTYPRPDINFVRNTWLGVINFYPFYGKLSLADLAVTQFDIYLLAGGGSVNTTYGSFPTYTGGLGIGFWLSKHFSARLEARYQGYRDTLSDGGTRQMDLTMLTLGLGILL